jgi:hypothetical protein
MSDEQRVIMQFLHKKRVHPAQIYKNLELRVVLRTTVFEACNIGADSLIAGAKTQAMIRGQEEPRSIISTPKVLHALERELFSWVYSYNEAMNLSRAVVLNCSYNSLGMKNLHLRLIPRQLEDDLPHVMIAKWRQLLYVLEAMQRTRSRHIIRGNEN